MKALAGRSRGALVALALCAAACGSNRSDVPPELVDAINGSERAGPYPGGPYGTAEGDTLPDFCLEGWTDPAAAGYDTERLAPICMHDFHEDGGARLLLVNSSAVWCTACRAEYGGGASRPDLSERLDERRGRGLRLLGTLFESNGPEPASPAEAAAWAEAYSLDFPFALDSEYALGSSSIAPTNRVVDVETMKVLLSVDGDEPALLFGYIDGILDAE
jgi:hypothetical protein